MKAMLHYERRDETISVQTDAYYEEQARQEEIYLEEREEDVRMILEYEDSSTPSGESLDEQRLQAAEELITGDSDDPPLSENIIKEMLNVR